MGPSEAAPHEPKISIPKANSLSKRPALGCGAVEVFSLEWWNSVQYLWDGLEWHLWSRTIHPTLGLTNAPVVQFRQILTAMFQHIVESLSRRGYCCHKDGDKLPINTLDFKRNLRWEGVYTILDICSWTLTSLKEGIQQATQNAYTVRMFQKLSGQNTRSMHLPIGAPLPWAVCNPIASSASRKHYCCSEGSFSRQGVL